MTTKTAEAPKSDFSALLADIGAQSAETDVLAKAMDKDAGADATIEAAAAEGADGSEGDDGKKKDCDGDGDEPMGKALKIIGEDGQEQDGIDAGPLLKSLMDRVDSGETQTTEALGAIVGLVKSQGALIKSLADQVQKLGSQGLGRRAVVTVHDKGGSAAEALAKSLGGGGDEDEKLNGKEFLLKASSAAEAGRIGWTDVSYCETLINKGLQPPEHLKRAVLAPAS